MKVIALATLATGLISGAAALACSSGTLYCGSTVAGLRGWDNAAVQAQIVDWPSGLTADWRFTLFRCEDHWYWEKADLHFVEACGDCRDNGSGHDDSCA